MNENDIIGIIKANNIKSANVIAIFYNKVCIGKYENEKINFENNENVDYSLCYQVRIFNKDLELKIVLKDGKILANVIKEKEPLSENMFFDEDMFLDDKFKKGNRTRLKVRNYLEIDENNQVIISNSRFVKYNNEDTDSGKEEE